MSKIVQIGAYQFACDNDLEVFRARTLFTKEEGTIRWLKAELKPGDVFDDVGANIGIYTIVAAKLVGKGGMVYAFEPHVANAAKLLQNVILNECVAQVRLLTCALSDRPGWDPFHYASVLPGSSGSQLGHTRSESGDEFKPVAVELKWGVPLDLLDQLLLPALVKIDVDGNELAVLRGMIGLLRRGVRSVQVEIHPQDDAAILALMTGYGYQLTERHYTANGQKQLDKGACAETITHNAIFRRPS